MVRLNVPSIFIYGGHHPAGLLPRSGRSPVQATWARRAASTGRPEGGEEPRVEALMKGPAPRPAPCVRSGPRPTRGATGGPRRAAAPGPEAAGAPRPDEKPRPRAAGPPGERGRSCSAKNSRPREQFGTRKRGGENVGRWAEGRGRRRVTNGCPATGRAERPRGRAAPSISSDGARERQALPPISADRKPCGPRRGQGPRRGGRQPAA